MQKVIVDAVHAALRVSTSDPGQMTREMTAANWAPSPKSYAVPAPIPGAGAGHDDGNGDGKKDQWFSMAFTKAGREEPTVLTATMSRQADGTHAVGLFMAITPSGMAMAQLTDHGPLLLTYEFSSKLRLGQSLCIHIEPGQDVVAALRVNYEVHDDDATVVQWLHDAMAEAWRRGDLGAEART